MRGALCMQNLATRPDHQPGHLQGCPVMFDVLSAREEVTNIWKKSWLLHHDNALAHNAFNIQEFLAENNIAMLEQPPYSPCDILLFPMLKGVIKRTSFPDIETINGCDERAPSKPRKILPRVHGPMEAWQEEDGRGWQSAFDLNGINSKATCCSLQFVFGIKDLCTQSHYFSNTPCTNSHIFHRSQQFHFIQFSSLSEAKTGYGCLDTASMQYRKHIK